VVKIVYSAGYGNLAPDDFLAKLKAAGITWVIDIRRPQTRSWCSKYAWYIPGMYNTLNDAGIGYSPLATLANHNETLEHYKKWLYCTDQDGGYGHLISASRWIEDDFNDHYVCLLCAEGNPFEADGITPRCHRVYVADALRELLGDDWKVEHL